MIKNKMKKRIMLLIIAATMGVNISACGNSREQGKDIEADITDEVTDEDKNGFSELNDELMELAKKADSNKDAKIQFKQITLYIELLKNQGTKMSPNITKHLEGEIWELRPGFNRILYYKWFYISYFKRCNLCN